MKKITAANVNAYQNELNALIVGIRTEADEKQKKRDLKRIDMLQRKISAYRSGSKVSRETKRDLVAYSFIAPNFIGFAVFTLVPIVFAFLLAFMEWDGSNPIKWVGIDNFTKLVDDKFFLAALKNTIIYCIGTVPLTMIASLALAIVLNQKVIGRGIFRTISFFHM